MVRTGRDSTLPACIAAVLGLARPTFAARVGVTRNVVIRWEGGKHRPVYFLRRELVTTARLYDALPADVRRIG